MRVDDDASKNKKNRRGALESLRLHINEDSVKYFAEGHADGAPRELWAVNANWDDDGWNLNANSVENPNPWDAGSQVCSRYFRFSSLPTGGEVFSKMPFFHPPAFLPIVSRFVPKETNCPLDMSLFSQSNCIKNRISSTFVMAISRNNVFCFVSANVAFLSAVNKSRRALSILTPRPNRSTRGIFL